jgi:hypothetical protein
LLHRQKIVLGVLATARLREDRECLGRQRKAISRTSSR